MDKIAKYYLSAESIVLLMIFLFGLFDPSFLFFGIIYVGFAVSAVGVLVSMIWCIMRLRSGGKVTAPFAFTVGNVILFLCMLSFTMFLASGGIRFQMMG